jgi:hypothetical protein
MINFVGLNIVNEVGNLFQVRQVSVVKEKRRRWIVGILIDVIDTIGVKS